MFCVLMLWLNYKCKVILFKNWDLDTGLMTTLLVTYTVGPTELSFTFHVAKAWEVDWAQNRTQRVNKTLAMHKWATKSLYGRTQIMFRLAE